MTEKLQIDLPAGRIQYREAGTGPVVVFVHGYLVDSRLWNGVVAELAPQGFRCIAPDWPMGAQQVPLSPAADLSPPGVADIIESFLAALDLNEVTIVGNDSGGAMSQILVSRHPQRISRLILTNCDTHENFPPGIFKTMPPLAKLPGGMTVLSGPFRIGAVARLAYKPFAKTTIPSQLVASWLAPGLGNHAIRRDLQKVTVGMHKRHTLAAAEKLRGMDLPILLAWAPGDRFFPISYAERLAGEVKNARIVPIPDAKTFVALDQPARLSQEIAQFAASS